MKLGFIGTGAITAAMITGLSAGWADDDTILVSPRNATVATDLSNRFRHVEIAASNQAVLDDSDIVVLAVRPQLAREVLSELRFRGDHHIISLIATLSLEAVSGLVAPALKITRAVPLPSVAHRLGPTPVFPPDPIVMALFDRLGTAIPVESVSEFDVLCTVTATMASYFAFVDGISSWMIRHQVTDTKARRYVAGIYQGLARTAVMEPGQSFAALAGDHATRGGLNEQMLAHLTDRQVFASLSDGLDAVLHRIEGTARDESGSQ
jgi:pyrroline-5-carboxylate reductase